MVIAGGGTGGHLYPGLAVAREIQRREPGGRIAFAGTARGLEARVVPGAGFPLDLIRSAGLKRTSPVALMRGLALVPLGLLDAWRLLTRRRPDVVIGVGGYSSGPVVLAAALRGIPTMLLEQNAEPGFTNRLLARWVSAAAVSYADTLSWFGQKGFISGNPVRPEFFTAVAPAHLYASGDTALRVLILGGSQGAHAINVAMVAAAPRLVRQQPDLEIVHQTGQRDLADVRAAYAPLGGRLRAEAFLDPVVDAMTWAHIVIGRAGATTLAELAAVGRPAILIPLPTATDDHQRRNARVLADAGAAVVIDPDDLTPDELVDTLGSVSADRARLATMAQAMRTFARPDAASRIVDRLLELIRA